MRSLEGGIDKVTRKCLKNAFGQSLNYEWTLFYEPFNKNLHEKTPLLYGLKINVHYTIPEYCHCHHPLH